MVNKPFYLEDKHRAQSEKVLVLVSIIHLAGEQSTGAHEITIPAQKKDLNN